MTLFRSVLFWLVLAVLGALLAQLQVLPLRMESPLAGTTLQQLRALRGQ